MAYEYSIIIYYDNQKHKTLKIYYINVSNSKI